MPRQHLDDAHPERLALAAHGRRGGDAAEQRQLGARQVRARAAVEGVAQAVGGGRLVDDDHRGARRVRARLLQARVERVALRSETSTTASGAVPSGGTLRARCPGELLVADDG